MTGGYEDFPSLVAQIGIPAAMMAVAVYSIHKEWFIPKKSVERERLLSDNIITGKNEYIAALKLEFRERYEEMRNDRNEWREHALRNTDLAQEAAVVSRKAADVMETAVKASGNSNGA